MAYSTGATPIPPPPTGGNRSSQHIVGGKTSNFGVAGANLAQARTGYQGGHTGSFFRNQTPVRPAFGQAAASSSAPAWQLGNQLQHTAQGQVRPANAPQGLGYQNATQQVRQHTLPGTTDQEAMSNLTYTPTATAAVAPPVVPPPTQPVYAAPGTSWVEPPAPTTGPAAQDPPGTPPPKTVFQHAQEVRTKVTAGGGLKVGRYLPGESGQGVQAVTGLKQYGKVFLPLVGTGKNQQVHWAYRMLM